MAKKAAAKLTDAPPGDPPTFERSLRQVQDIVRRLESGEAPLSESLRDYEAGIRHLRTCHELLDQAERRVDVLCGFDAEGNPITEPMADAEAPEGAGRKTTSGRNRSDKSSGGSKTKDDRSGRRPPATDLDDANLF